jgi:bacteriorhodopsin
MLKRIAMIFGAIFLLLGLLGFVPGVTTTDSDGMQQLLGLFMVDTVHNIVHLLSGIVGLVAAMNTKYAKWYLVGFGVVFGLVALVGFFDETLFGLMRVNTADAWLHLVLTVGMLGAGLGLSDDGSMPAKKAAM